MKTVLKIAIGVLLLTFIAGETYKQIGFYKMRNRNEVRERIRELMTQNCSAKEAEQIAFKEFKYNPVTNSFED